MGFRGTVLLGLRRRPCVLQALHGPPGDPVRTKNSKAFTPAEKRHVDAVKLLPCSVCSRPGPSDAHHINQGQHFTTVALCKDCHQGSFNGIHGQRRMWLVMKMDELAALNVTLSQLQLKEAAR